MEVSLDQAIEIHGRALKYRKGAFAGAAVAEEEAERCRSSGDLEGFDVWRRVRAFIETSEVSGEADDSLD